MCRYYIRELTEDCIWYNATCDSTCGNPFCGRIIFRKRDDIWELANICMYPTRKGHGTAIFKYVVEKHNIKIEDIRISITSLECFYFVKKNNIPMHEAYLKRFGTKN